MWVCLIVCYVWVCFCCFFLWFDCVWFVLSWCVPHHWQKTVDVVGWSVANRQWKWWGGHWQMTVKVVGWELAGSRGGSEIGGVITGKGAVETGGWVLANHWEIDEESTTRVGLQTTQTTNQHQQKTITNTQEAHKTDISTQHTNNRISKTIGIPSKKALKINSLLRRLLGIWSKVHET